MYPSEQNELCTKWIWQPYRQLKRKISVVAAFPREAISLGLPSPPKPHSQSRAREECLRREKHTSPEEQSLGLKVVRPSVSEIQILQ